MKKELFVEAEIQIIPIDPDKSVLCCSYETELYGSKANETEEGNLNGK